MKTLDMRPYRPYADMGTSCLRREIGEKKVVWPEAKERSICDGNFTLRAIGRNDVDRAAEFWRASYPEVYGSIHGWMLDPGEYEQRVAFKENGKSDFENKPNAMLMAEENRTGDIAMASMLTKFDQNLQVEASFFAIHPDYRKGERGFHIWEELHDYYDFLESSGAEYITVFCETWQNTTQYVWFKRFGWKVAGIFPGNMTRWSGGREEYRGCTVYFYRLLNGGDRFSTKPEEWQLLPEMKRLWDCLEEINRESDDAALQTRGENRKS
jgi:hypothetical protein